MTMKPDQVAITTNVLQTVVLVIAVAAVTMEFGRKDTMIQNTVRAVSELRAITQDLAKMQVALSTTDENIRERIADMDDRLDRLEDTR
jgi:hypothetical protein